MKKEIRDKWVEALRSGKFPQGRGNLFNGRRYCCLGVYAITIGCSKAHIRPHSNLHGVLGVDLSVFNTPTLRGEIVCDDLAQMNDGTGDGGRTFNEIADWIEQNIPATD